MNDTNKLYIKLHVHGLHNFVLKAASYCCMLCAPALEVTSSLQHPSPQSRQIFGEKNCSKVHHTVHPSLNSFNQAFLNFSIHFSFE